MQSMRIMSRPPSRIGKQNQLSQFIEVTSIEKMLAKFQQRTKVSRKATNEQTFICTGPDMATVVHGRLHGRFMEKRAT